MNPDSETALELATIALCQQLGYTTANCRDEWEGGSSKLDRQNKTEVVLTSQLQPALQRLNPQLPPEAINQAIAAFTSSRRALSLPSANRKFTATSKTASKSPTTATTATPPKPSASSTGATPPTTTTSSPPNSPSRATSTPAAPTY